MATNGAGSTDVPILAWENSLFRITSFNLISFSTPPFWNSNSPWVIFGVRLPQRTQLQSNSTSHLHVYPRASRTLLLVCPVFRPATCSQNLPYMPLLLRNAPTLLYGPCILQHGDTSFRNLDDHLPSDALPNTRRPETSLFYVLLTVYLSISLDKDQLDSHLLYFTIRPLHSSTCFKR